jgi:hypothetical protein
MRRTYWRLGSLLLILLPLLLGARPPVQTAPVSWSSGFMAGWLQDGYPPDRWPWAAFTHIIHFSAMTRADGTLEWLNHGLTPSVISTGVSAAHAHGKPILLSIGGVDDQHWDAACSPTVRPAFVRNLVAAMQSNGYDGLDLDVEQDFGYPDHTDYHNCVADIRTALNALTPRPLLTVDGDPDWQAFMVAPVWPNVDAIQLMTYNTLATQVSPQVANYTSAGVPARLLVLGIGLDDGGVDGPTPADCGAKAQYAAANGLLGVMSWTISGDAMLHNGQTPCFNALMPYVQTGPTPTPGMATPTRTATATPPRTGTPLPTLGVTATPAATRTPTRTVTPAAGATATPTAVCEVRVRKNGVAYWAPYDRC